MKSKNKFLDKRERESKGREETEEIRQKKQCCLMMFFNKSIK